MKCFIAVCLFAALSTAHCGLLASTLIRAPAHDSAIVQSDRVGGNFAYSTIEGHAYQAVSPIVQRIQTPVAVSVAAHQVPLGLLHTPIAVSQPIYAHQQLLAQPIYAHQQILAAPVLAAPVAPAVATPVAPEPVAAAPAVTGSDVDADTVAIESA